MKYKLREKWKVILRTGISIALLWWLAFSFDWQQIGRLILEADLGWISLAIVWIVLSMVISVSKWQVLLYSQKIDISWLELWHAYWAGLFFNNFLPSSIGGDALRIIWVGKFSHDSAGAAASVIVERILATAGIALVGLSGAIIAGRLDIRAAALLIGLLIVSFLLLGIILQGRIPTALSRRKGRIIEFLQGMAMHGTRLQAKRKPLIWVLLLSVVFQLMVVAVNYSIFKALGISSLAWGDILYVIPITSVAAMLPVGINGYGVREGAYVALLASYQVARGSAFTASLLFAFLVSLCSLYGGWTFMVHRQKEGNINAGTTSIPNCQGGHEGWE